MEKRPRSKRKTLTAIDMYFKFKKENPDVTYFMYKETLTRFNKKLIDKILLGETFKPGFRLGNIRIKKVRRRFRKPKIDWGASNALKKQGVEKYLVYFTDPWWYRWYWEKKRCIIKNKTVYCMIPTTSNSAKNGARNKLSTLLQTNPLAALRFKQ